MNIYNDNCLKEELAMNEVYQCLLTPIIYQWAATHANAKKGSKSCSICFCNDNYHASIYFHKENVIELSILDKYTQDNLFYLHFQMKDIKMAIENINVFFDYLQNNHVAESNVLPNITPLKDNLRILLSCTSGLTTSYFAYLLENYLNQGKNNVTVDAISYMELDNIQSDYDFILLAPQISYKYPQLREKYGKKVFMIDSYDFATGNIKHVLDSLVKKKEN